MKYFKKVGGGRINENNRAICDIRRWNRWNWNNKETKECNSIENCQHKVTYMSQTEADTIVKEIRVECTKHEECSDCAFNDFCKTL